MYITTHIRILLTSIGYVEHYYKSGIFNGICYMLYCFDYNCSKSNQGIYIVQCILFIWLMLLCVFKYSNGICHILVNHIHVHNKHIILETHFIVHWFISTDEVIVYLLYAKQKKERWRRWSFQLIWHITAESVEDNPKHLERSKNANAPMFSQR